MTPEDPTSGLPIADAGVNRLDRHTRLCISLSGHPSNLGTRFHNYLYAELGLNFVYKALSTDDLPGAVTGIRALGIRGCGVSMPFKEQAVDLLDEVDPSARDIGAVNTIVNDDGTLVGYNTDVMAVQSLLPDDATSAVVAGSGGMAAAVVAALRGTGVDNVTIVARNRTSGPALAERFGARWLPWGSEVRAPVLVNATPLGMEDGPAGEEGPFGEDAVAAAGTVVEVVASPPRTALVRLAEQHEIGTVTGDTILALQAAEQFTLYTGDRPTPAQVRRAQRYSRRE